MGIDIGRTEKHFEWPGRPPALAQRRAFEHDRTGIGSSHVQICCVGTRIDPHAVVGPAKAGRLARFPAFHLYDAVIDIELEMLDEPVAHLSHRHTVAHRHGRSANEAFLSGEKQRAFDGASRRVGPIQHPDRLARFRSFLKQIEQRCDKGIDPTAKILKVEKEDIGGRHHLASRPAHFAVKAEDGNAISRIGLIRSLDHVVLLVALETVLRTESGGYVDLAAYQHIERML